MFLGYRRLILWHGSDVKGWGMCQESRVDWMWSGSVSVWWEFLRCIDAVFVEDSNWVSAVLVCRTPNLSSLWEGTWIWDRKELTTLENGHLNNSASLASQQFPVGFRMFPFTNRGDDTMFVLGWCLLQYESLQKKSLTYLKLSAEVS